MFHVFSVDQSDLTANFGELGGVPLLFSASKFGLSHPKKMGSQSHAAATQIIVFNARFRIKFTFLWCDMYIRYGLSGCVIMQSHARKLLHFLGANFAYQIIVVW